MIINSGIDTELKKKLMSFYTELNRANIDEVKKFINEDPSLLEHRFSVFL